MYALIESGGQQHKVEPGRYVTIKRLAADEGAPVVFKTVLMVRAEDRIEIGQPAVAEAEVHGSVRRHLKGKKVNGFKYKAKKGYSRRWGARAYLTQVTITKIVCGDQVWEADLDTLAAAAAAADAAADVDDLEDDDIVDDDDTDEE